MESAQNPSRDSTRMADGLAVRRVARVLGFLIMIAALSVAGTYWMVTTLQQAIQMELPMPGTDAKTLRS